PHDRHRDIVIQRDASSEASDARMRFGGHDNAALATFRLVLHAVQAAETRGVRQHVGNVFSADLFYTPDTAMFATMAKYGVLGIEMEAAGIYPIAAEHGAEALAICTVSDVIGSGEALTAGERQTSFGDMIAVALEAVRAAGPVR